MDGDRMKGGFTISVSEKCHPSPLNSYSDLSVLALSSLLGPNVYRNNAKGLCSFMVSVPGHLTPYVQAEQHGRRRNDVRELFT